MSLASMTGFGRASARGNGCQIAVEWSSVNRRQLEIRLALPRALAALEPELIRLVQNTLSRGQVTGTVTLTLSDRLRERGAHVDRALARAFLRSLRQLSRELNLRVDFEADVLTRLPEVVSWDEAVVVDADRIRPVCLRAARAALAALKRMREKEGRSLRKDLSHRLHLMHAIEQRIARRAPTLVRRQQRLFLARLKRARLPLRTDDPALLQELAAFAERSDITEEVTRLESHLRQATHLVNKARDPVGRPLDFLAQEMLREINTIGAKSNDGPVARWVVAFKTELERFREQVQNVE